MQLPMMFRDSKTVVGQWGNSTHLSIIVLKSRTPAMSLAANLDKRGRRVNLVITCNINSYETAKRSTTAFEPNDTTLAVIV